MIEIKVERDFDEEKVEDQREAVDAEEIFDEDDKDFRFEKSHKRKVIARLVAQLIGVLAIIAFVIVGLVTKIWHPTWVILLAYPLATVVTKAIAKKRYVEAFTVFPVTLVYIIVSAITGLWHPLWVLFFIVPLARIIGKIVRASKELK